MGAVEVETNVGWLWSHRDGAFTRGLEEHGFWELHLVRLLEARLGPGMAFLDVGAHIGYFTVLASTLVGPSGRVVAVEPDPASVELLRANLARHGCTNVDVLALAAWDSSTRLPFTVRAANRAVSWVSPQGEGLLVEAAPLDELLDAPFELIKSDAEGSDHVALFGARRLLAACPLAVVEFWPRTAPVPRPIEPREVAEGYQALGRELALVSAMGELEPITIDELLALEAEHVELGLQRLR